MDAARFDNFVRSLFARASRRRLLGLAALGLTALPPRALEARKRRKRKKKTRPKVVLNEFGCVDVGRACRGNSVLCCSGICEGEKPKKGKKDKSRCLAHNVLDCPPGADSCQGATVTCGTSLFGACFQTTGRASFCGTAGTCVACQKDADCEPDFGPGAACIVCPGCGGGIADTRCFPPDA